MIPKVINYCWFGNSPKPAIVNECILSWKKYCPSWEIKEWNENNFDIMSIPYMREAYENKKYAFVSDMARLLIIYKNGGVYLDTDVELFSSLDEVVNVGAFYVFESIRNIGSGLGFGAEKEHSSVKAMLHYYEGRHFLENGKMNLVPCPAVNTEAFKRQYPEFSRNGKGQKVEDVLIFSSDEYNTFAKHHGTASWVDGELRTGKSAYRDTWLKHFLRDAKKYDYIEKYLGKRAVQCYTFFSYDFLELGLAYYIRRNITKRKHK